MKEKKQNTRKLPGKVIAAITFNNLASNCMWMLINYYLLFFYTDVLLIPASAATAIFTIARIWDVINDPMMGVICDRTRSKEGKSRFWLRRVAIPAGIFLALRSYAPTGQRRQRLFGPVQPIFYWAWRRRLLAFPFRH